MTLLPMEGSMYKSDRPITGIDQIESRVHLEEWNPLYCCVSPIIGSDHKLVECSIRLQVDLELVVEIRHPPNGGHKPNKMAFRQFLHRLKTYTDFSTYPTQYVQ